jgi:hypothetical protein
LLATFLITDTNAQVKPVKKKKPAIQQVNGLEKMGEYSIAPGPATAIVPLHITGIVLDSSSNQPLSGASIRIKETTRGIAADTLGIFSLNIEKKSTVELEFSAIGYETETYSIDYITSLSHLTIRLKPLAATLQSVEVKSFCYKVLQGTVGGVSMRYSETVAEKIKKKINDWTPTALKKDIKVYPNPVIRGDLIRLGLAFKQTGEYKLELLNAGGQVMWVKPLIMHTKEQVTAIPTQTTWSAGVYWIRISAPDIKNVYQAKVLVQ